MECAAIMGRGRILSSGMEKKSYLKNNSQMDFETYLQPLVMVAKQSVNFICLSIYLP